MTNLFEARIHYNGNILEFDGNPYGLLQEDGLLSAPLHRITEQGPQQHGNTDIGYRLDPRVVNVLVGIIPADDVTFWAARQTLLAALSPLNAPALEIELGSGERRRLDVHLAANMSGGSRERTGLGQDVAAQLVAADPTFYDPVGQASTFSLGGGGDAFPVPHAVPHGVGASVIDQTNVIVYAGNWLSLPHLIRITGPITNCVITNETTNEKLDFTGTTIAGGDYYDIDCRYGRKTVIDNDGVNQIADLTSDSDLATFHLAPDSAAAPGGVNSIRVTGSGVTEATGVAVNLFVRYLGI